MASESTEEGSITVSLAPALEEWIDAKASELGVDRETVLVRLVSSHRDAAAIDGPTGIDGLAEAVADAEPVREAVAKTVDAAVDDAVADRLAVDGEDVDATLEAAVREQVELTLENRLLEEVEAVVSSVIEHQVSAAVEEHVESAVEKYVESAVEEAIDGREADTADAVEGQIADHLETVRADFREKLQDVRERVIQVKREADDKAPADHTHDAFARVDAIGGRLADVEESVDTVESELSALQTTVESIEAEISEGDEDLETTVEEIEERLKTVAWVVSDLREAYESRDGSATVELIKRSAAEADAARAKCERCGEGVEVALLTEPECPHCQATVTEVAPASGIFGKPRLLAASQLEAGDE